MFEKFCFLVLGQMQNMKKDELVRELSRYDDRKSFNFEKCANDKMWEKLEELVPEIDITPT